MHLEKDPEKSSTEPLRIGALDALRLTAALVVFREHFYVLFEVFDPLYPLLGLLDAKAAVVLFFVLSGYVLSISLSRNAPALKPYVNFGIRRFFRIYPLYWVALALTFAVLVWFQQKPGFTYVADMPSSFLDGDGLQLPQWLLQTTLIAPGMVSYFALPTVWTLMVEAKVAIVFPLLAWGLLRTPWGGAAGLLAALVFGSPWLMEHVIGTALYLGQFGIGILLFRLPTQVWKKFNTLTWCLFLAGSVAFYRTMALRYVTFDVPTSNYLCAVGSAGFIICTLHWDRARAVFEWIQKILKYDLSYGIYILHYPVLMALRGVWLDSGRTQPLWGHAVFSVILTVALAYGLHRLLELPAIRLGRKLTLK